MNRRIRTNDDNGKGKGKCQRINGKKEGIFVAVRTLLEKAGCKVVLRRFRNVQTEMLKNLSIEQIVGKGFFEISMAICPNITEEELEIRLLKLVTGGDPSISIRVVLKVLDKMMNDVRLLPNGVAAVVAKFRLQNINSRVYAYQQLILRKNQLAKLANNRYAYDISKVDTAHSKRENSKPKNGKTPIGNDDGNVMNDKDEISEGKEDDSVEDLVSDETFDASFVYIENKTKTKKSTLGKRKKLNGDEHGSKKKKQKIQPTLNNELKAKAKLDLVKSGQMSGLVNWQSGRTVVKARQLKKIKLDLLDVDDQKQSCNKNQMLQNTLTYSANDHYGQHERNNNDGFSNAMRANGANFCKNVDGNGVNFGKNVDGNLEVPLFGNINVSCNYINDTQGNGNRTVIFRSRNKNNCGQSQSQNNNNISMSNMENKSEPKSYIERLNGLIQNAQLYKKQIFSDESLKTIHMWHNKIARCMQLGATMFFEFFPASENNHRSFNTDYVNVSTINIGSAENINVVNAIPKRNLMNDWIKSVMCYMKHNHPDFTSVGELFSRMLTIRTKKNQVQFIFGSDAVGFNWVNLVVAMQQFCFIWNVLMRCGSVQNWINYNNKMVELGRTQSHVMVFMMDVLIYKLLKDDSYIKFALLTNLPFIDNKKAYEARLQIRLVLSQMLGVENINDITVMRLGTWSTKTRGNTSRPFYSVLPGYIIYLKLAIDLGQLRGLINNNLGNVVNGLVIRHDEFLNLWRSIQSSNNATGRNTLVPIQKYQIVYDYVQSNHCQNSNNNISTTTIQSQLGSNQNGINLDDLIYPC